MQSVTKEEAGTLTLVKTGIGADHRYNDRFPEAKAWVEGTGKLIPISLYFLLNGKLPEDSELVKVLQDGGRCTVLPQFRQLNGREVFIGVKGVGYEENVGVFKPEDPTIRHRLEEYAQVIAGNKDPSLRRFITAIEGDPAGIGSSRPLGGQSRAMAEWSLNFSRRLSKDFDYKGAHFAPTVAIAGYDEQKREVLGNLNNGKKSFAPDDIVQEFRLLPSTTSLESFLSLSGEDTRREINKEGESKFRKNFLESLYGLAIFSLNSADKGKLEFFTLTPPFGGSPATESVIAPDGTVYWKDLDNLAISYEIDQKIAEMAPSTIKRTVETGSASFAAYALSYVFELNRKMGSKRSDLEEATALASEFIDVMGKMPGVKFTGFTLLEDCDTNNPFWKRSQIRLNYINGEFGNGALKLNFVMPVNREPNSLLPSPYFGAVVN